MNSLFVYGILQFPEILEVLLGKEVPMTPARLPGYQRFAKPLRDGIMRGPGIRPVRDVWLPGKLLYELDQRDMKIIDLLEGGYDRTDVIVQTNGGFVGADVYLPKDISEYSDTPWDEGTFRTLGLEYYRTIRIPEILASLHI